MSFDTSECYFAGIMSDGEIKTIYKDSSWIDNSHKNGGYSAARYGRIRNEQIKAWHKKIVEEIDNNNKEFYLDSSFVNKTLLEKQFTYKTKSLYKGSYSSGYSGTITGVHQTIKLKEQERLIIAQ